MTTPRSEVRRVLYCAVKIRQINRQLQCRGEQSGDEHRAGTKAGKATPKWHAGSLERFFRRSACFAGPSNAMKARWSVPACRTLRGGRGNAEAGAIIFTTASTGTMKQSMAMIFWIRHLRAHGGGKACRQTRSLIRSWLNNNSSLHMVRWRPDVMGERLANLVQNYGWYGESATVEKLCVLLARSVVQARRLALDQRRTRALDDRFSGLRGLAVAEAAWCLPR